jgi:uncharacterized membrane protein
MNTSSRVASVDIVRGLAMVLMAIDHVRVYAGVPAGGPDVAVFFTRWVTHFCAPVFAFLAGTSIYLSLKGRPAGTADARFLVIRGLVLVALELTLIKWFWTFRLDYSFTLAGVIWMLGWCMVLMAPVVLWVRSAAVIGWLGVAIVAFQQVFGIAGVVGWMGWPWEFVYPVAGLDGRVPDGLAILYVIVPWIGVMAAGYGFGAIVSITDLPRQRSLCLRIGLAAIALFLLVGTIGAASGEGPMPFVMRLLNQQKYPASQLFLLMTLGPAVTMIGLLEGRSGGGTSGGFLAVFGRVPMFYYLLHIPLIHGLALLVNQIQFGSMHGELYATAPFARVPAGLRWSLPVLYGVFGVAIAVLFPLCRWMVGVKARFRGTWWVRFV